MSDEINNNDNNKTDDIGTQPDNKEIITAGEIKEEINNDVGKTALDESAASVMKAQDQEEAPKEEAPKEEAPKEEKPKETALKEEAPKEEAPKEAAPFREEKKRVYRPRNDRNGNRPAFQRNTKYRRKVCRFCINKELKINYREAQVLDGFITERGKILPRRITGTCSRHQKELSKAIKHARLLALLPFVVK